MSHVNDIPRVSTLEVAEKMYGRGSLAWEFVRAELNLIERLKPWHLDGVTVEITTDAVNITGYVTLPGRIQELDMSICMDFGDDSEPA